MRTIALIISTALLLAAELMAQAKPDLRAKTSPSKTAAFETQPAVAPCDDLNAKVPPGAHTVKLSWNASVPASASAADAVIGYIVYRSTKPDDTNGPPINLRHLTDTTCSDVHVLPGLYGVLGKARKAGLSKRS